LEIYQYNQLEENLKPVANRKGFGHIAFHVENVEKIREDIMANGGTNLGEISKAEIEGVGTLTFVYMRDPEGNILEIQNWY
jgi:predicted enzyme related to lactoylglutathione lyase